MLITEESSQERQVSVSGETRHVFADQRSRHAMPQVHDVVFPLRHILNALGASPSEIIKPPDCIFKANGAALSQSLSFAVF